MTPAKRTFVIWFVAGIIAFAFTAALHYPLFTDSVPGGILDHQSAPDAEAVDTIQKAWKADGLLTLARLAMLSDLVFITIFGIGCIMGGLYFAEKRKPLLRTIGVIALASGAVFMATDYAETISQVIEIFRFEGDDTLAAIASGAQPMKMVASKIALAACLLGLLAQRFSTSNA